MLTKTEATFKCNLKRLRESRNLNIKQTARLIGIDYSYYHRLENPARNVAPGFAMLEKICTFYGIQPYRLFQENCPLPQQ